MSPVRESVFRLLGVPPLSYSPNTSLIVSPASKMFRQQAAAIQNYYVVQKKLPFPILIEAASEGKAESAAEKVTGRHAYLYNFYPQVLVIDKKGKTRAILLGTLPGQEDRLRAKVEELLKDPS